MSKLEFKRRNLKFLLESAANLRGPAVYDKYSPHTLLKLITIASYSKGFCDIANSEHTRRLGYDKSVYVDLFAGSGIVKIRGTNDLVAGSTVAATHGGIFDYAVAVEMQERKSIALQTRLSNYLPSEKFNVIHGDCNLKIGDVIAKIKEHAKKPIILCFVDPEGVNINAEMLKALSGSFGSVDFIINVTAGVEQVRGSVLAGQSKHKGSLDKMYGNELTNQLLAAREVQMTDAYRDVILPWLGRPVAASIPVHRRGNHLVYTLLFCTRERASGPPPWVKIWNHIAIQLEGSDGDEMRAELGVVMGRSGTMDQFVG